MIRSAEPAATGRTRLPVLPDALFIVLVAGLPALAYLDGLGFYSDDLAFRASMILADEPGFACAYRALVAEHGMASRPLQAAWLAGLHVLFGDAALPTHSANLAVFLAGLAILHAALRRAGADRPTALAVPLVFASLPHDATVRFWYASFQIPLSATLFFAFLYAIARFLDRPRGAANGWLAAALGAMTASALAYEVFLPLFAPAALALGLVRRSGAGRRPAWIAAGVAAAGTLALLAVKLAIRDDRRVWSGDATEWADAVAWLAEGVVRSTLIDNGLALPANVARLVATHPDPAAIAAAALCGLAIAMRLHVVARRDPAPLPLGRAAGAVGLGAVLWAGSYGVFLDNFQIGFSPTGIANRVHVAGAVGLAVAVVGGVAAIGGVLPRAAARIAVPGLLAAGCALGILVTATLGGFWADAAKAQGRVLARIEAAIPDPPPGTAILVDGICPYIGPAPVFESSWDLAGALQIRHGDPSLRADVIKPSTRIGPGGLTTTQYGGFFERYPYGPLIVVDGATGAAAWLEDAAAARAWFERAGRDPASCVFTDGGGVPVYRSPSG
ncbi:MAG: hypothetical protein RID91_09915 [Azospirillaceae bacterium]